MHKVLLFGRWKLRLLTWILGFAVFCMWVGLVNAADWKTYQLAGFRAYHQGDTQMAVAQFEVASTVAEYQRVPDNELAVLYKVLATAYLAEKRYERARKTVREWGEILERNSSADWVAAHHFFRNRLTKSLDEAEAQARSEDEQLARLYKVLAKAYYTDKRYRRAWKIMDQWSEVLARNTDADWAAKHLSLHDHLSTALDDATEQGTAENMSSSNTPTASNTPTEGESLSIWPAGATPSNEVELAPAASSAHYGIHLASYDSERSARAGWAELQTLYPSLLRGTKLVIRRADLGEGGVFYRVFAGIFDDPERADSRCSEFTNQAQYCAVMSID